MKSFTVHIYDKFYRRVFKNKKDKPIMDYVSVGIFIPIIAEGEFIGY